MSEEIIFWGMMVVVTIAVVLFISEVTGLTSYLITACV